MMRLFNHIRHRIFTVDIPKVDETNTKARAENARGQQLLDRWTSEDIRRINRTGNFVEGWLRPESRGDER